MTTSDARKRLAEKQAPPTPDASSAREDALEMLAAFDHLLDVRLHLIKHSPAAESRAWDRLYLAAERVRFPAHIVEGGDQ